MTDIIESAAHLLQKVGFAVNRNYADDVSGFDFENGTVLGFVLAYETATELLNGWARDTDGLLTQREFQLRSAGPKAWNSYVLLLAREEALFPEAVALNSIEEDLVGLRKIARAGCSSSLEIQRALLPLVPLQSAPELSAVDTKSEIRERTTELPSDVVEYFLSSADPYTVLQLLGEHQ